MEVRLRSGRSRTLSKRTAHRILERPIRPVWLQDLQEDDPDPRVVVHFSTVQQHLHKHDLHRRVIRRQLFLRPHHKIQHQKFAKEHLTSGWKPVLRTDEPIKVLGRMSVLNREPRVKYGNDTKSLDTKKTCFSPDVSVSL